MPEAEPLRPGDPVRLGSYRLLGRLGEGGQGVVYLALGGPGRQVALKLLHTRLTGNPQARHAFARELAAAVPRRLEGDQPGEDDQQEAAGKDEHAAVTRRERAPLEQQRLDHAPCTGVMRPAPRASR